LLQLAINALKAADAIKLIRRKPEPGKHDDEHQSVPRLQSPFDRVEDHRLLDAVPVPATGCNELGTQLFSHVGDMHIQQI